MRVLPWKALVNIAGTSAADGRLAREVDMGVGRDLADPISAERVGRCNVLVDEALDPT